MKQLIWLLAVAAPALSQALPEPGPMHAVVLRVDLPPAYAGILEAYAVLVVEKDDGTKQTLYMPYFRSNAPRQGQHCAFDIYLAFAKGLVGSEVWSKERRVTGVLQPKCDIDD